MTTFDVWKEPWIPTVSLNGASETLCLRDTLLRAHTLREICCESPLETCATLRFCIAFLMDAYAPETAGERKRLLRQGKVDPSILNDYLEQCRGEGVSFDLFDSKRPFLQATYDAELDAGKEKSAAYLFHALPTGNNHIHFDHRQANDRAFLPGDCLRGILASQLFSVHMTGDYPSSVNDTPCYYVFLQGKNLFETMALSMVSKRECGNILWDSPPTAWRDSSSVLPKSEFADVSMLGGLTWQPRRITLIPEENGTVQSMYYQPGRSFHPNDLWRDPHVCFSLNKDGNPYTLKPQQGRAPWRDVGAFAMSRESRGGPATIITQSQAILADTDARQLLLYGIATSNAKYEGWVSDRLTVSGSILLNPDKANRLRKDVQLAEDGARITARTVQAFAAAQERTKDGAKKQRCISEDAKAVFFDETHRFLFAAYMDALASVDDTCPGWEAPLIRQANGTIRDIASRVVKRYASMFGLTARDLAVQTRAMQSFRYSIHKLTEARKEQ